MNFSNEFERVYKLKKVNAIDEINDFCAKWEGVATVECIPYLMKLYYDGAETSEQNEFISHVINSIVKNQPNDAIEAIVSNCYALYEEDAQKCMLEVTGILIFWNTEYIPISAVTIAKADTEISQKIINFVLKRVNETKNEKFKVSGEKFLSLYYLNKRNNE